MTNEEEEKAGRGEFRKLLITVYDGLGLAPVASGYLDCCERLNEACLDWYREHPGRAPGFDIPDLAGPMLPLGGLCEADRLGWCVDDNAREFVKFIDCRTNYEGTLLQFQILLTLQGWITEALQNASGGQA